MNNYFNLMEETVLQNDLVSKPGLIFNCDESGMPLSHRPGRVIAKKGKKHVTALVSGNKTQITLFVLVLQETLFHPWSFSTERISTRN